MNEKQLTMNEATQIWWFVGWRTTLTLIVINVALSFIEKILTFETYDALEWIGIIISILVSVYYFKIAVNRDYKTFRLSANSK